MVLYHATAKPNVPAILREGLIPAKAAGGDDWASTHSIFGNLSDSRIPSVYLTPDLTVARAFAQYPALANNSDAAILRVRIPPKALRHLSQDREMTWGYRYMGKIPPTWISVQSPRVTIEQSHKVNARYGLLGLL